ncbi:MAG: GNAT family protein [Phycisphaerae bacterium]|jgi:RimJ/RimL family protein N-acetyltransferase
MLEGKNVILRLFTEEDVKEYVELENDYAELGEFLDPTFHSQMSRKKEFDESKGWWDDDKGCMVMADKEGRMIGVVAFFRRSPYLAGLEVGYMILRREDRGHGYGTEALRIFSAYLFDLKPVPRLELLTVDQNVPARRIAEKCGYKHEGTFPNYWFVRGKYVTGVQYGLMREDCPTLAEVVGG